MSLLPYTSFITSLHLAVDIGAQQARKAPYAVVEVHDIVADLYLPQLLERQRQFARSGAVALEGVLVEAVENPVVGKYAYAGLVVYETLVQCAVYGLEVDLVASVGENLAQAVELLCIVRQYQQPVTLALGSV